MVDLRLHMLIGKTFWYFWRVKKRLSLRCGPYRV